MRLFFRIGLFLVVSAIYLRAELPLLFPKIISDESASSQLYIWLEDSTSVQEELEVILPGYSPLSFAPKISEQPTQAKTLPQFSGFGLDVIFQSGAPILNFTFPLSGLFQISAFEADGAKIGILFDGFHDPGQLRVRWPYGRNSQKNSGLIMLVVSFQGAPVLKQWVPLTE